MTFYLCRSSRTNTKSKEKCFFFIPYKRICMRRSWGHGNGPWWLEFRITHGAQKCASHAFSRQNETKKIVPYSENILFLLLSVRWNLQNNIPLWVRIVQEMLLKLQHITLCSSKKQLKSILLINRITQSQGVAWFRAQKTMGEMYQATNVWSITGLDVFCFRFNGRQPQICCILVSWVRLVYQSLLAWYNMT